MTFRSFSLRLCATLALLTLSSAASAALVEFTVDPSLTKVTLAGTVLGQSVAEQGPGSLTTSFSGKIIADLESASIRFPGGSVLDASTNGVWRPGPGGASGSAPADYAAQVSSILGAIRGALRNLVLDLTSGPLPIQNGQFDASLLTFSFLTNSGASFDYDAGPILGSDGIPLGGASTNRIVNGATLTTTVEGQTLTISIDTEFKFTAVIEDDSTVRLTGSIVARRLSNQPTISSIEIRDQKVILHVTGAGAAPRLESSTDLKSWTTRTPERSGDAADVVLTLPLGGAIEFYRVAQ